MNQPNEVLSVVIPMKAHSWLLPSALVAEVLPLRQPERPGQGADWLLGWLTWRGEPVPLISFERFNLSGQVAIGQDAKIIVLNTVNEESRFYAVIIQGNPKQIMVSMTDLQDQPNATVGRGEAALVQFEDELMIIPNLDAIEKELAPHITT